MNLMKGGIHRNEIKNATTKDTDKIILIIITLFECKDRYKSRDWEIRSGLVYNKDFRALE